jgi:hypothetical protein
MMVDVYTLHGRMEVRGGGSVMATDKTAKGKRARKPAMSGAVVRPVTDNGTPVAIANGSPAVEQIQRRAYELFLARGAVHGNDWIDWFTAERELIGSHLRTE